MKCRALLLLASAAVLAVPALPQQTDRDLFAAVAQEADATKKLALLTAWSEKFPDTAFGRERNLHYLACYSLLENAAVGKSASRESVNQGERAASVVIQRAEELFAAGMRPATVSDANWLAARTEALQQAHSLVATVATSRADFPRAESAYGNLLRLTPDDAAVLWRLGSSIVSQKKPKRYPEALYYLSRAVGRMPAGDEHNNAESYLRKVYETWHGDLTELDETKALAAARASLPGDWNIPSAAEVADARRILAEEWDKSHPELALWRKLKIKLDGTDGMEYFASQLRDSSVPALKGTVAARPRATEVVLAMEGTAPEVTLRLDSPLREELKPGTEIAFTGVPLTFRQNPWMLVFEVKLKDLIRP